MPTGPCWTRASPDFVRKGPSKQGVNHSQIALEWLDFESQRRGVKILHAGERTGSADWGIRCGCGWLRTVVLHGFFFRWMFLAFLWTVPRRSLTDEEGKIGIIFRHDSWRYPKIRWHGQRLRGRLLSGSRDNERMRMERLQERTWHATIWIRSENEVQHACWHVRRPYQRAWPYTRDTRGQDLRRSAGGYHNTGWTQRTFQRSATHLQACRHRPRRLVWLHEKPVSRIRC